MTAAAALPPPAQDASPWVGPAPQASGAWLQILRAAELAQIEAAKRARLERGFDLAQVQPADLPLPTLAPRQMRRLDELLCLPTARSGGLTALDSSTTLYNEVRRGRPALVALRFEPLATERRGEVLPGTKRFEIAVFNPFAGRLAAEVCR